MDFKTFWESVLQDVGIEMEACKVCGKFVVKGTLCCGQKLIPKGQVIDRLV